MVITSSMLITFVLLAIVFSLITGILLGLLILGKFDIAMRIGARNDMEFYAKEMNKKLEEDINKPVIRNDDLLPPGLGRDYALPREFK